MAARRARRSATTAATVASCGATTVDGASATAPTHPRVGGCGPGPASSYTYSAAARSTANVPSARQAARRAAASSAPKVGRVRCTMLRGSAEVSRARSAGSIRSYAGAVYAASRTGSA